MCRWANWNPVLLWAPRLPQPPPDKGSLVAQAPWPLPLDTQFLAKTLMPWAAYATTVQTEHDHFKSADLFISTYYVLGAHYDL